MTVSFEPSLAPPETATPNGRRGAFTNAQVSVQSWYVAARSREVPRGTARTFPLLNRRITLYRDDSGTVHALDARCPHLGADLGQGKVVGDGLQCAFHHWCFAPDGTCRDAPRLAEVPARRTRSYPVQERWGLIWLFNGPTPLFDLPAPRVPEAFRPFCPPAQHIRCHPHLVIANGLDATHFEALHGMALTEPARLSVEPPYRVSVTLYGRPTTPFFQRLTGTTQREIVARFTTIGGNLAWAEVEEPVRFYTLFTGRPSPTGGCQTQLVFFLPRTSAKAMFRALASMYVLLHDDRRILDTLHFFPGFTAADAPLRAFADLVDAMPSW